MPLPALVKALALLMLASAAAAYAQVPQLPLCGRRPTVIRGELVTDSLRWCPEAVIHQPDIEPYSFTALAVAPDGTLYATRPRTGQVMRIHDSDGDHLPDTISDFVSGLDRPHGLVYHEGALYIAGGAQITRAAADGALTTIAADLPAGSGFWTGGLEIADDGRLYVAIGAPCNNCAFDAPGRGAILSMALDGSDIQLVASGFRQPADIAFFRGALWTLDSAPRPPQRAGLDELNRVISGGWYGFPQCLGADTVNIAGERGCADSIPPAMLFGSGAVPSSLEAYPHATLPGTEDTLLVALSGDPSQTDIVGYKVIMVHFDAADQPLGASVLLPYRRESNRAAYLPNSADGLFWQDLIYVNEVGLGIYPQQPLALAVSPQGWIYISLTGGRIIALRPRDQTHVPADAYPLWTPMHPDFDADG